MVNMDIMEHESKIDMLNYWIEEIVKYFREIGFEVDPLPKIRLD